MRVDDISVPRRNKALHVFSFAIFAVSLLLLDVASATHGGPLLATIGIGLMAVASAPAAVALLDNRRRPLWSGVFAATLGTGIAAASVGLFSKAGVPLLGYGIGIASGLSFWIVALLFTRTWVRTRSAAGGTAKGGPR